MAMKPNQFKEFLRKSWLMMPHRAIFVSGPVGVGKSECVKEVAEELGWELQDIRLSLLDPTDLRGLPAIDKEKRQTIWTRPIFLPDTNDTKNRVLFFDEFNTSMKSMQNGCLQLMLDRCIGEYKLPDNTRVVTAGNRIQDVGGFVSKQSPALNNRGIHVEFQTNFDDWKQWAFSHKMHPMVMGYHNFTQGKNLQVYSDKQDTDNAAFPTPRTWAFLGLPEVKITDTLTQAGVLYIGLDNGTLHEAINGTIGEGIGNEFTGYLKVYKDLPDPKEILLEGKNIVPKEPNVMYALCASLVYLVLEHQDKIDRLINYSMGIGKDFSVAMIQDMLKTKMRDKMVHSSAAFTKWIRANKWVLVE